jgi:hypothetical protein
LEIFLEIFFDVFFDVFFKGFFINIPPSKFKCFYLGVHTNYHS